MPPCLVLLLLSGKSEGYDRNIRCQLYFRAVPVIMFDGGKDTDTAKKDQINYMIYRYLRKFPWISVNLRGFILTTV